MFKRLDESDEVITDNPLLLAKAEFGKSVPTLVGRVSLKVLLDTSTKDQMRVREELEWDLTGMTLKLHRYKQ